MPVEYGFPRKDPNILITLLPPNKEAKSRWWECDASFGIFTRILENK